MSRLHWLTRSMIGSLLFCSLSWLFHCALVSVTLDHDGRMDFSLVVIAFLCIFIFGPVFAAITKPEPTPGPPPTLDRAITYFRVQAVKYEGTQFGVERHQFALWLEELRDRKADEARLAHIKQMSSMQEPPREQVWP